MRIQKEAKILPNSQMLIYPLHKKYSSSLTFSLYQSKYSNRGWVLPFNLLKIEFVVLSGTLPRAKQHTNYRVRWNCWVILYCFHYFRQLVTVNLRSQHISRAFQFCRAKLFNCRTMSHLGVWKVSFQRSGGIQILRHVHCNCNLMVQM